MSCLCNLFGNRNRRCYANFSAPSCNRTSPCMKVRCGANESVCGRSNGCGCGCGCGCRYGCGCNRSMASDSYRSYRQYQDEDRCAYDYATTAYETEHCHD